MGNDRIARTLYQSVVCNMSKVSSGVIEGLDGIEGGGVS